MSDVSYTTEELSCTMLKPEYDEKESDVTLPKVLLGGYILVKMIPELAKKDSLIVLSEDLMNRSAAGNVVCEVVALGSTAFKSEKFKYVNGEGWDNHVKVGSKILIKRMAGTVVPGSKGTFQTIDDDAIMAVY